MLKILIALALLLPACGRLDHQNRDEAMSLITMASEEANRVQAATSQSVVLDTFDSHLWVADNTSINGPPAIRHTPHRRTEGSGALHMRTPMIPSPTSLDDNRARFDIKLPEPEDWSGFDFVTIDVYMAENPIGLAEARLYLANSAGESVETPLILGWQLYQWENHQMTFPLKGNAHRFAAVPETILSDVRHVGLSLTRFSDGGYGNPYTDLNFVIDNMRLGGGEAWDSFDQPAWRWRGIGDSNTGITHNERYAASAGSLRVEGTVAGTPLPSIDEEAPMQVILGQVKSDLPDIPVTLTVATHVTRFAAEPLSVAAADADGWRLAAWKLPEPVAPSELIEIQIEAAAGAVVYVDSLEMAPDSMQPFDLQAFDRGDHAVVSWRNPPVGYSEGGEPLRLWAQAAAGGVPTLVCEVSAVEPESSCRHDSPPSAPFVYFVEAGGSGAQPGPTITSGGETVRLRPEGADYEIGYDPYNGALRYIRNAVTGAVVSTGNRQDQLWTVTFLDETDLRSLGSDQYSASSDTHRFSIEDNGYLLKYEYEVDGRSLTVDIRIVPVDQQRFDLRASIRNDTGRPIRTVSLPRQLSFEIDAMERVLFPIQEGLTLLPRFFEEQRSSTMARPPMFADVLAYEGLEGHLSLHVIQDSRYQAELIDFHPDDQPVFQPTNLATGGSDEFGYFSLDMVTYIPDAQDWVSPTVRVSIDRDFRQVAADYRIDNGIDEFPTLIDKLGGEQAAAQLASSPILAIELYKTIEWLKAPEGAVWDEIRTDWLDRLPEPSVLHLTHWQEGRDWYEEEYENHKLEDDHPEALPIWWERYGSESQFLNLLGAAAERDFMTMPFTNWTVWNTYDPDTLEIPALEDTPAAATKLRGETYPYIEYKGYMVEPWSADVRNRNTAMFELYAQRYPQDLMFVDMTGERSWRYLHFEADQTASAAAYTQGVVNENLRLSEMKPLFTEGVFDRIGGSVAGYAQTLRQKQWNQILVHLGGEYEHWVAYPFAADVLHDKVAFYQHDLNIEVWPGEDIELATYYSLLGYNYMVDVTAHINEDEEIIWALDALQKVVNARTFGQPLVEVEALTDDYRLQRTSWGSSSNPFEILANFDVDDTATVASVDGYGIAPGGFLARSAQRDVIAGMFVDEFGGAELADGVHWITVEYGADQIVVRHPIGADTAIRLDRPDGWDDEVELFYELGDGSLTIAPEGSLRFSDADLDVEVPAQLKGQSVRRAVLTNGTAPVPEAEVETPTG